MTAVFRRMSSIAGHVLTPVTAEGEYWAFNDFLHNMGIDFFTPLVRKHGLLDVEYSILRAQIIKDYKPPADDADDAEGASAETTEQLVSALMMSEILAHIYRYHLDVPREVARMHADQLVLVKLLEAQGYHFDKCALHLLQRLPEEKSKYTCSYILTDTELYYIDIDGFREIATLTDYGKLARLARKKIENAKSESTCHLTFNEVKDNITSNGGHTPYDEENSLVPEGDTVTRFIRRTMANLNWYRLTLVRAKRVFNASVPLAKNAEAYCNIIAAIDAHLNPFLAQLSWLFFAPRLSTNLFLMIKHIIPGSWMNQSEKDLDVLTRIYVQFQRHWFEIANDAAWMLSGILNCFLWIGALAPVSIYLNVTLYVYDVVLASLRAFIELNRLKNMVERYDNMAKDLRSHGKIAEEAEVRRFINSIEDRIFFEQKRQLLPVANTVMLLLGAIFCLPAMLALSPVLPLIGASLMVTSTVVTWFLDSEFRESAPDDDLSKLIKKETEGSSNPTKSVYVGGMVLFRHIEKPHKFEDITQEYHCCFG